MHRPFVFLDIETTGGSPRSSRVLEVGAIRVESNNVVASMNQLINPNEPVPYFITGITGITDKDIWNKPDFASVASELEDLLEDAIFVAHNVNFDYGFLQAEFSRLGVNLKKDRLCTARLSRKLYPQHRSHKLDALIARHGYKVANRHRALDDAEVLYKFYKEHVASHGLELYKTIDSLITYAR